MRLPAPWLALAPLGVAALVSFACDETLPDPLRPPEPPGALDAGTDATIDAAPVPKGSRTLGVEVVIDALDFPDEVRAIVDAGARTTNATFAWNDVERAIDAGDAEAGTEIFNAGLHIVNLILGTSSVRASFAVAAIDATGARLVPDLAGRPLDDPEVAARFDEVTDYAFSQLRDLELDAYLVGVDVDAALGADAAKWAAFAAFVARTATHARATRPGVKVGFTMSAAALVDRKDLVAAAVAASDVVAVSKPASLDAIVAAAPPGKPILVVSTDLPPADAFAAWDRHAERIPILTFAKLSADLVREARARGF